MTFSWKAVSLKDIVLIGGLILTGCGFYYNTSWRLTTLEASASEGFSEVDTLDGSLRTISERLVRIEENVASLREDVSRLENIILDKQ